MIYLSIAVKLLIGMIGIILFLRISGKTQMAQLTPLDSVNAFVLGALVGGVIYTPGTPVWYLLFAFAVWTGVNVCVRYLMRLRRVRRAIMGDPVMLVRDRKLVLKEFRRNGLEMEQHGDTRKRHSSTGEPAEKSRRAADKRKQSQPSEKTRQAADKPKEYQPHGKPRKEGQRKKGEPVWS